MPETTCTLPRLSCFVEVPQGLLDEATTLWHQSLERGARRENQLIIEIPANWKRAMNRHSTHVVMDLNAETGMLYGLSEAGASVQGGWGGSCMPRHLVVQFLRGWIDQTRACLQPCQPGLFD